MSHNLNFENGKHSYYGVGELPWHKHGTTVELPVSNTEARTLAGLDWEPVKMPLYRQDMEAIESHFAIIRSDNQKSLGVVTKQYEPVQNTQLFDWLEGLDGFADVVIETAGCLGAGETVWIMARCDGLSFDIRGDEHVPYMLLANGHVGNRKLQIMPTGVRVVCANTLAMASQGALTKESEGFAFNGNLSQGFALRHTSKIHDMMTNIQEAYAKTTASWKATEEVMRHLADKPLTEEKIGRLFNEPFEKTKNKNGDENNLISFINGSGEADQDEADEGVRAAAIKAAREGKLRSILASEECTRFGTRATLFAGLNAVTSYLDHDTDRTQDASRFASAMFGERERTKRKAFKIAVELAET